MKPTQRKPPWGPGPFTWPSVVSAVVWPSVRRCRPSLRWQRSWSILENESIEVSLTYNNCMVFCWASRIFLGGSRLEGEKFLRFQHVGIHFCFFEMISCVGSFSFFIHEWDEVIALNHLSVWCGQHQHVWITLLPTRLFQGKKSQGFGHRANVRTSWKNYKHTAWDKPFWGCRK